MSAINTFLKSHIVEINKNHNLIILNSIGLILPSFEMKENSAFCSLKILKTPVKIKDVIKIIMNPFFTKGNTILNSHFFLVYLSLNTYIVSSIASL